MRTKKLKEEEEEEEDTSLENSEREILLGVVDRGVEEDIHWAFVDIHQLKHSKLES